MALGLMLRGVGKEQGTAIFRGVERFDFDSSELERFSQPLMRLEVGRT